MKSRMGLTAVLLLMLLLILSACSGQGDGSSPGQGGSSLPGADLDNTFWTLQSMAGSSPLPEAEITAGFLDGKIMGSTGCNNYFAAYDTRDDLLILTNAGVTEMACLEPEGVMEVESQFLDYFYQVDRFHLSGEELQLITADGESLVFVPRP